MAWYTPLVKVFKWIWSAFKWAAKQVLNIFAWSFKKPLPAAAIGLGLVSLGWLLEKWWWWAETRQLMASFGWAMVTTAATGWLWHKALPSEVEVKSWFQLNVLEGDWSVDPVKAFGLRMGW